MHLLERPIAFTAHRIWSVIESHSPISIALVSVPLSVEQRAVCCSVLQCVECVAALLQRSSALERGKIDN